MNDEFGNQSESDSEKLSTGGSTTVTEDQGNRKENLSNNNNKISPVSSHINIESLGHKLPCPNLLDSPKSRMCISDNGLKLRDNIPLSPILPVDSPCKDSFWTQGHAGKENFDISWHHESNNQEGAVFKSSSNVNSPVIYHASGNDDIRHQLLVQRTFNTHEAQEMPQLLVSNHTEINSSFPEMLSVKTSSPKSDNVEGTASPRQPRAQLSPFLTPYSDNASDFHSVFQTPVRGRQYRHEQGLESTPSVQQHSQTPSQPSFHSVTPLRYQHAMTPRRLQGALTPSSTGSPYAFTPGRNFFNPFEIDSGQLHLPVMSPGVFKIGSAQKGDEENKESFWSVEHAALIRPVDIKESDILKQHFYQQKRDKEKDVVVQSAINKFFSSEYILPSPWSEKTATNRLPRTPGSLISVSSQTTMSVPPDVDLFAELEGKFQLPEHKIETEMTSETISNSFIRRKLLNQLNENDSPVRAKSSVIPSKSCETSSTKNETPDLETQTPCKKSSGHFSSSPIRESTVNNEYQPMSESELLASPELSPIAGRGRKSIRTSDIFHSHQQDHGSPREMMQLDFSSILDEPDDLENDVDKTDPLFTMASLQQQSGDNSDLQEQQNPLLLSSSHANADVSAGSSKLISMIGKTLVNSGLSAESTVEINATVPQSLTSQDTGYQTASMQSTVNQDFVSTSNSIHLSQETLLQVSDPTRTLTDKDLGSDNTSFTNQFTGILPFRSGSRFCNSEQDWLSLTSGEEKSVELLFQPEPPVQRREICKIRKVKTLSDMRRSKEKRGASRNLTQSFNEEDKNSSPGLSWSCERLNESLSNFVCDSSEKLDVRYLKAETNLDPLRAQRCISVSRDKITDYYVKEKLASNNGSVDGQNCLTRMNSFPSDKRSMNHTSADIEAVRHLNEGNESKYIKLVTTDHLTSDCSHETAGKFLSEDESTLVEARKLLGKSEALRMQLQDSGELEADTFYQLISEGSQQGHGEDGCSSNNNLLFLDEQVKSTSQSQSSFLLSSLKEKINSVEGDKLGSEIAAEILRRAGEDLAQLN